MTCKPSCHPLVREPVVRCSFFGRVVRLDRSASKPSYRQVASLCSSLYRREIGNPSFFLSHQSFIVVSSIRSPHSHHHSPTVSSSHPHKHSPRTLATYSDSQTKVLALRNIVAGALVGNLEVNSHSGGCASVATLGLRGHLKPQFLEGLVEERRCSEQQQEAYQKWCSTC